MKNRYRSIVYNHLKRRNRRMMRFVLLLEAGLSLVIFLCLWLVSASEGNSFSPYFLLVLLIPVALGLILGASLALRASRSVREEQQLHQQGYFVDITDYLTAADVDIVRGFSTAHILRGDGTDDDFAFGWRLTQRGCFKGARVFSFIKAEHYDANIETWKQTPDFDLAGDVSLMDHFVFFVFDEALAGKVQARCTQPFTGTRHTFALSPPCTARYVRVPNVDEILLDLEA